MKFGQSLLRLLFAARRPWKSVIVVLNPVDEGGADGVGRREAALHDRS